MDRNGRARKSTASEVPGRLIVREDTSAQAIRDFLKDSKKAAVARGSADARIRATGSKREGIVCKLYVAQEGKGELRKQADRKRAAEAIEKVAERVFTENGLASDAKASTALANIRMQGTRCVMHDPKAGELQKNLDIILTSVHHKTLYPQSEKQAVCEHEQSAPATELARNNPDETPAPAKKPKRLKLRRLKVPRLKLPALALKLAGREPKFQPPKVPPLNLSFLNTQKKESAASAENRAGEEYVNSGHRPVTLQPHDGRGNANAAGAADANSPPVFLTAFLSFISWIARGLKSVFGIG